MSLLSIIGLVVILLGVAFVALWIYQNFVYTSTLLPTLVGKDQYAIITGVTSGIGEGYAEELASKKSNLVLVSRSQQKLDELAKRLENQYKIKTVTVAIDFSNDKPEEYVQKLKNAIEPLKISILVNNVGINNTDNIPILFAEQDPKDQVDLVNVNIHATMNVTRVVIPKLVANGRGLIINMSSYMGKFPTPLCSIYSGTKAFIDSWSTALRGELASQKIEVLSLTPMYVQSQMTNIKKTSLTVITPRALAKASLKQVGAPLLPASNSPYWVHALTMFAYSLIPQQLMLSVSKKTMTTIRSKMLHIKKKNTTQKVE